MSKRIAVTVPDKVYELLEAWAKEEGRPLASLCNYLLEKEAKDRFEKQNIIRENLEHERNNQSHSS